MPPPDPGDPELTAMFEPAAATTTRRPTARASTQRRGRRTTGSTASTCRSGLVAEVPPRVPAAVDTAKFVAAWKAGQRRLAGLSSDSHIVTAADADHLIWLWRLDLVLSTVADALTA